MQKITPHLWLERDAGEAAAFYASVFGSAPPQQRVTLDNTPSGTVEIVNVGLHGQTFTLLAAGPLFRFTPAVSFLVLCGTAGEVDELWQRLAEGGAPMMELGSYPFSERYGWIQDRYGLSWQLMAAGDREIAQKIVPSLMFTGQNAGRAEEAIAFYTSVFRDGRLGTVVRWEAGEGPDAAGTIKYAGFTLEGQQFAAMDSAYPHGFGFNEAISFIVNCATQEEVDSYWARLSADPNAEQCGWLKDKFGLSWQVVPAALDRMLAHGSKEEVARVTEALLQMKKLDMAKLEDAFAGK